MVSVDGASTDGGDAHIEVLAQASDLGRLWKEERQGVRVELYLVAS
jgi:hypothetical protein